MLRVLAGGAVAGRAVGAAVGVGGAVVAAEDGVVDVVSKVAIPRTRGRVPRPVRAAADDIVRARFIATVVRAHVVGRADVRAAAAARGDGVFGEAGLVALGHGAVGGVAGHGVGDGGEEEGDEDER